MIKKQLLMIGAIMWCAAAVFAWAGEGTKVVLVEEELPAYSDSRPVAWYRLEAKDHGVVYRHGQGPDDCDYLGARDVWVWKYKDLYYMHYDGAGKKGWLACLATSKDLVNWTPKGPVLDFGKPGTPDSASASYGTVYFDGKTWHMFYLGTPNVSPPPNFVPHLPYSTLVAESDSPTGPWKKRYDVTPFKPTPDTYYSGCASPGQIVKKGDEYLMFFAAATNRPILRTIGIARTRNLEGPWTIDPEPIVPLREQVENSSLYFEKANNTWFLFTNHIAIEGRLEYTDAVWVYWSKDLNHWDAANKAVVLDPQNCKWSKQTIGLPSVVVLGNRLAVFYDGFG
ncbi:MAG: hypothetical protein ACWGMZ_05840, partial [Thermoguttaceae bacterium]